MAPQFAPRWALPLWSTTHEDGLPAEAIADRSQPSLPRRDSLSQILPLDVRLVPTTPMTPTNAQLVTRQQITTVPSIYGGMHSPDPGTVVGITLGSVGGFILVLWLIYTVANLGNPDSVSSYGTASVVSRRSRRSHATAAHRRHHHHRSPRRERETVEVRTRSRAPVVVEEVVTGGGGTRRVSGDRVERVVLEETTTRRASRSRVPPPRVVSEDSDSGSEDEVVVIEEHSPPRRHRSKRRSRSPRRGESGFREVDPDRFGGGPSELRSVRRGSGSRRR